MMRKVCAEPVSAVRIRRLSGVCDVTDKRLSCSRSRSPVSSMRRAIVFARKIRPSARRINTGLIMQSKDSSVGKCEETLGTARECGRVMKMPGE